MGITILAGWECCDKWEGCSYNDEGSGQKWTDANYSIAQDSMYHEAVMMESHPSILGFLVGSDFWPDDRAARIYEEELRRANWSTPIILSASQRGFPPSLGNGGMKMDGPYDWVPPSYWYDNKTRLGSAAGFGSELGAGVGTPEYGSLRKFLDVNDMFDLWRGETCDKSLYHMSTAGSPFSTRRIYNAALEARYGAPETLRDYLLKAQMSDYEATGAQFGAYLTRWTEPDVQDERPATGVIYWMLNNAWPSLHWNLFDYYLHPDVYLVDPKWFRTIKIEFMRLNGSLIFKKEFKPYTMVSRPSIITKVPLSDLGDGKVGLLRLRLYDELEDLASRSVYWLSNKRDVLDWEKSTWYCTPITTYANFTALVDMEMANVVVDTISQGKILLRNTEDVLPAVFIRLNLINGKGEDVVPVKWSDNYVTLWPDEMMIIKFEYKPQDGMKIEISGRNIWPDVVDLEEAI